MIIPLLSRLAVKIDNHAIVLYDSPLQNNCFRFIPSLLQARTQDFLTGGGGVYKVLKSPSQPNTARGYGELCKLPQRGLGQSLSRQRFWRLLDYNEDVWCYIISNLHRKLGLPLKVIISDD